MVMNKPMSPEAGLKQLKADIENFCRLYVPSGEIEVKDKGKIIHDTIWRTNYFEPYEIEIIHSPLFQRLRYINQMGFVDFVYPSARHSRFEHSLGVTILAGRMIDAVMQNSVRRQNKASELLGEDVRKSIRMSALLHDVGHCLYSHTSELVYGAELKKLIKCQFPDGNKPSPHEFLSYLIVTSDVFRDYFEKIKSKYCLHNIDIDIDDIALRIVGHTKGDELKEYATNFIAGPLDADKLDYFYRDSQFSGIPIQLDLDRLLHELDISSIGEANILTVSEVGVICIEQMIFNKMILYSSIYTHHKVEAIDCMFRGVFEYIEENNIPLNIGGKQKKPETAADFLYLVDYHLFALADETEDEKLKELINNIRNRKLLKRAFLITRKSIETENADKVSWAGIIKLLYQDKDEAKRNQYLRDLAREIHKESKADCSPYEIWVDIPKSPISDEIQTIMVRPRKNTGTQCEGIEKYYPLAQYKDLYETNRLNGYVFAPERCREQVAQAAKTVLEKRLSVKFNDFAVVR